MYIAQIKQQCWISGHHTDLILLDWIGGGVDHGVVRCFVCLCPSRTGPASIQSSQAPATAAAAVPVTFSSEKNTEPHLSHDSPPTLSSPCSFTHVPNCHGFIGWPSPPVACPDSDAVAQGSRSVCRHVRTCRSRCDLVGQ